MYLEQTRLLYKALLKLCRYYWRGFNVVVALPCQSVQMRRSRHWRRAGLRLQSIILRHKLIIQPENTPWGEYDDSESVVWSSYIWSENLTQKCSVPPLSSSFLLMWQPLKLWDTDIIINQTPQNNTEPVCKALKRLLRTNTRTVLVRHETIDLMI